MKDNQALGKGYYGKKALLVCVGAMIVPQNAWGQNSVQTEDTFREIFVTAGYSAAFGAALGAALLPFSSEPIFSEGNLRYVAGGASLGFVLGSGLALYGLSRPQGGYAPYGAPTEQEESYGYEQGRNVLPSAGALVVGRGTQWRVALPAISPRWGGAQVALAHLEF